MQPSRIIINNQTYYSEKRVVSYVMSVIDGGRVSGDELSYCYHTRFADGVHVSARRTKSGSDVFTVYEDAS